MLTQEILKEILVYDPCSGELMWKERERKWFKTDKSFNVWNKRYAHSVAGHLRKDGYRVLTLSGEPRAAHRIIWILIHGFIPDQIDHIDGNRSNNKIYNLREATNRVNSLNQSRSKNNSSGHVGVVWHKVHKKWHARIKVNYKQRHLGCFKTIVEAIKTRKLAEVEYGFHENHGRVNSNE